MSQGHPSFAAKFPEEVKLAREMGSKSDPDHQGNFPWTCAIRMTHSAFGRLGFQLHFMGGHFGQSFCVGGIPPSLSRAQSYSVECLIWLRPSRVSDFENRVGTKVRPTLIAHINRGETNDNE
jgi:hypothetical protein